MMTQITATQLFARQVVWAVFKGNMKALHHRPVIRGIHCWMVDPPYMGPLALSMSWHYLVQFCTKPSIYPPWKFPILDRQDVYINSVSSICATVWRVIMVNIGLHNGSLPDGTKALPESQLTFRHTQDCIEIHHPWKMIWSQLKRLFLDIYYRMTSTFPRDQWVKKKKSPLVV